MPAPCPAARPAVEVAADEAALASALQPLAQLELNLAADPLLYCWMTELGHCHAGGWLRAHSLSLHLAIFLSDIDQTCVKHCG